MPPASPWAGLRRATSGAARLWGVPLRPYAALRLPALAAAWAAGEAAPLAAGGWSCLLERPLAAAAGVAAGLCQPVLAGILPVCVWRMVMFALFLWAQARAGAASPAALLWGGVQAGLWATLSLDGHGLTLEGVQGLSGGEERTVETGGVEAHERERTCPQKKQAAGRSQAAAPFV
jgi:hypothetical protein